MRCSNPCRLYSCKLHLKPIGFLHALLRKETEGVSKTKQTKGKTWSSRVPAGNTSTRHSSGPGPVLWCMQGVQVDPLKRFSYLKPNLITLHYAILCVMQGARPSHFIGPGFCQSRDALKQSMWLVWLHPSVELKPVENSHSVTPKETRGTPEAKQAKGKTYSSRMPVATAVALFYGVCRRSSLINLYAPHISRHISSVFPMPPLSHARKCIS